MRQIGGDFNRRADSMMSTDTYRMDGDLLASHKNLREYLEVKKGRSTSTLVRKQSVNNNTGSCATGCFVSASSTNHNNKTTTYKNVEA